MRLVPIKASPNETISLMTQTSSSECEPTSMKKGVPHTKPAAYAGSPAHRAVRTTTYNQTCNTISSHSVRVAENEEISNSLSDVNICETTPIRTNSVNISDYDSDSGEMVGHSITKNGFFACLLNANKRKGFTQITC